MTGRLHGFIEQSHLMRVNVENKQEGEKALIAAACSDAGCGSGSCALSIPDLLCIYSHINSGFSFMGGFVAAQP